MALDVATLVRDELARRFLGSGEPLDAICAYALVPTGKLLRPTLLVESAVAVGGSAYAVLVAAVGTECGHVSSLIHDDIIDGDEVRRGRASVPHRYGTSAAIIAGDRLLFAMFGCLARCRDFGIGDDRIVGALEVMVAAGLDLCRGEHTELGLAGRPDCPVADYLAMADAKTGALFRGACGGGAILGGGTPEEVEILADYGGNLGVAFQIHDDLLPYVGDEAVVGKAAISDVRNRRPTLPVILAYQAASPADRARLDRALSGALSDASAYAELNTLLDQTGALAEASDMAVECARLAEKNVLLLPSSEAQERLRGYAELAIDRDV